MDRSDRLDPPRPVLDEVTGALEALTALLEDEDDFRILVQQVCRQVTRAVPGVDAASLTLLRDGRPHTVAATGTVVAELDQDQYARGEGPCLTAARTGDLVRVAVDDAVDRWPAFARSARQAGFGSFLAAPVVVGDRLSGAVNCYGVADDGFAEVDGQVLELYTTAVEALLRTHRRYLEAKHTAEHLRTALGTRAVIDQAKGILMAVRQIDADNAFTVLVAQSQRENRKLREIAERFIADVVGARAGE